MRILMLSHGYPPTLSGVTLVVQKISRALVRLGHEVLVVTASDQIEPYEDEDEGVHLRRLWSIRNPFWSEGHVPWVGAQTLQRLMNDFDPDIIHTHENALLSIQLLRLERLPSVPYISSCYFLPRFATQYLRWGALLENILESLLWKYAISNLNRYEYVIFSTPTQRKEFIRHGLKVPGTAISNGVDIRRYYPGNEQAEEIEKIYCLPSRPRILFVGRLMKDKKIDLLIQAMKHVRAEQNAHLLIVGRGDEYQNLKSEARRLGLEDNVHLLGYVPESDLPAMYRSSDLFAITSVCEVQSIPALQAIATGLPIVAVDAAALPELVRPGHNGLLVPPDNSQALGKALLKVIDEPDYRTELGQASLELVDGHSEERTFMRYAEIYQDLRDKARRS